MAASQAEIVLETMIVLKNFQAFLLSLCVCDNHICDNDDFPTTDEIDTDGYFLDCDNDGIPDHLDPDECQEVLAIGFSPNGDGKNEAFVVSGISFGKWSLTINNRLGKIIYQSLCF